MTSEQKQALELVLELALENLLEDPDMPEEVKRQEDAIATVQSLLN